MPLFESYDRRINQILPVLKQYGINSCEEAEQVCLEKGIDVRAIVRGIQNIAFENAGWAYTVGAAIAIKKGCKKAADAAEAIGEGLQSFCIPGSVADDRKVGLGHGNLAAMLLREETECFCFLAGHESFAAAEGAIGIARSANKVRQKPLRVILNGLGKDAAYIISRINGFTYCQTKFDYATGKVEVVKRTSFSDGERSKVNCYGADDVREGVASCGSRVWTCPSPATPRTRPASSTRWPAPTRRSALPPARSTSPWLPAAARAARCTRTTWLPVLPPTASPTRWAACTAMLSSPAPPPCPLTWR